MKTMLKILSFSSLLISMVLFASAPSTPNKNFGQVGTPMTWRSPMRKLTSSFRLTPKQTWQQKVAADVAQDLKYESFADNVLNIPGTFQVDEKSWQLGADGKTEWKFSVNVEKLPNGHFRSMIFNIPDVKCFAKQNKTNDFYVSKICTSIDDLVCHVQCLIGALDPRSA